MSNTNTITNNQFEQMLLDRNGDDYDFIKGNINIIHKGRRDLKKKQEKYFTQLKRKSIQDDNEFFDQTSMGLSNSSLANSNK